MNRAIEVLLAGRRDRGAITVLGTFFVFWLVVMCGVLYDGAVYNRAARAAHDDAQEAARAGAEALNAGQAISGQGVSVDPSAAANAATTYLTQRSHSGTVTTSGATLTVTVTAPFTAPITHFSRTITAAATADLVRTLGANAH